MSVPITLRRDFSASQLRGLAKKSKDGPQARRLRWITAAHVSRPTTLHTFLPRSMPITAIFLIFAIGVTESLRLASAEGTIR